MSEPAPKNIASILADRGLIEAALAKGAQVALMKRLHAGEKMAIWEDGKVIWIPASEALARLREVI